jgi:hypothetical protein
MLSKSFCTGFLGVVALIMTAAAANAATLSVNCGGREGLTTIGAAIKALQHIESSGPNTIRVSGACLENVLIQNVSFLTIAGANGASITDASGGTADVIDVRTSSVTITGMTIDGKDGVNFDSVDCEQGSHCTLIGNTIRGNADAVGVYLSASAVIVGGSLESTTSSGIFARGDVIAIGVQISGNPIGILVQKGGRLSARVSDPAYDPIATVTQTTVANNSGAGVTVLEGAEFLCSGCVIRNNAGDGIDADVSVAVTVQSTTEVDGTRVLPSITNNAGVGVRLGDLTSGSFHGPASAVTVMGNAQPDIVCNSGTTLSRGALVAAGGSLHTNCLN